MLLGVHWGRHHGVLQYADTMVCDVLTRNRMCRGQKSYVCRGAVKCDVMGVCSSDVFCDKMFACYSECIGGVITAYCNTVMQ